SKAFRVYNKRTKRVEENMHIDFLEDQPNVTGTGPNWMFDLDFLANSMNYIPVSVENQVNVDTGIQDSYVAGSSRKDKGPTQEYILLLLQPHRTRIPIEDVAPTAHEKPSESSPKDNDVQVTEDAADKEGQHQMTKDEQVLYDELEKMIAQEVATSTNKLSTVRSYVSTATKPYISAASTPTGANAGESSFVYLGGQIPIDASTLPNADLPTDLNMTDLEDVSNAFPNDSIFNGAYDDNDVEEPKNISQALQDESWVEAMQEELLQFKLQKVWVLVDLLYGKKNRGNQRRCMSINLQALLILLIQTKSIRGGTIDKTLFIKKKKSDIMLVQVYVDDIIFGSTKKSMCTEFKDYMHKRFQMSSMGELTFFLRLQVKQQPDGIFISQDKYVADILKKIDFCSIRTATTPIESNKPLVKDEDGVDVDVHVYRSMIGSLMYLTASRPDIMFVVYACARFQVSPKASHLNAVKRIFRYLKHQPKLGLWYSKDSPFELEAYSDSDYGGASLDRKSTTGGCQFIGKRLISWQCKKQTIVENSTIKVEYVAGANCYGKVLSVTPLKWVAAE
ncbi:putative ribonuclease H-like domain-containing protein, partial [Tanacetum coccineum]